MSAYATTLVIRFGSNLVLTRFLMPDAYGLMAVAMVVLSALAMFSDIGLKPNVIQSKNGHDPAFLNTVWVTQIVRNVCIWLFAAFAAVVISLARDFGLLSPFSVYGNPELPFVIFGMSFAVLIGGFESTKSIEQSRNLSLARLSIVEILTQLVSVAVMLSCLFFQRSIWVLVAGSISASLARTVLSFRMLSGTRNRWQWNKRYFLEIIQLGKWIFLSTSLFFFAGNGDRMLLGGLVDARTLGIYAIAYLFFSSIDQVLTRIIVDISFPALGEIVRNRPAELKRVYYKLHFVVATFAYACTGALFASGPAIIRSLYNEQYQAAGQVLQILSVALLTLPFRAATQTLLLLGAARVYFVLNITRAAVLFVAAPIGFNLGGFTGAVWGIVFSFFASIPIVIFYAIRFGIFSLWREALVMLAIPAGYGGGVTLSYLLPLIHIHFRS